MKRHASYYLQVTVIISAKNTDLEGKSDLTLIRPSRIFIANKISEEGHRSSISNVCQRMSRIMLATATGSSAKSQDMCVYGWTFRITNPEEFESFNIRIDLNPLGF